jgi:hypothetical protein
MIINKINGNVMTKYLSVAGGGFQGERGTERAVTVSERADMRQVRGMEALETSRYSESFPCWAGLRGRVSGQDNESEICMADRGDARPVHRLRDATGTD